MIVDCCDNCKRPFEKFKVNGWEDGFGFVVKEGDIEHLMSDLTFTFYCFTDEKRLGKIIGNIGALNVLRS